MDPESTSMMFRRGFGKEQFFLGCTSELKLEALELRDGHRDGEPMVAEEFDDVLFRQRVHELAGRAWRCHRHGAAGTVRLLAAALADALEERAGTDPRSGKRLSQRASRFLERHARRLEIDAFVHRTECTADRQEAGSLVREA